MRTTPLIIIFSCLFYLYSFAQTAKERSVMVSAEVQSNPAQINFSWPADPLANHYTVYKRNLDANDWGESIATLEGNATSYIDNQVQVGQLYEYAFFKQEYTLLIDTLCIPPNTTVRFAIRDFNKKGLCCNFGKGFYKVEACGMVMVEGGNFFEEEITDFTLCSSSATCEEVIISISPDMFPNSTYWQVNDQSDGSDLGNSGPIGQFLAPRPAYGFITAGVEVAPTGQRGSLLLLIDDEYLAPLSNEIDQLKLDLIADGWKIEETNASKNEAVTSVKSRIKAIYDKTPDLKAVYILGHVPVPYSGDMYPDTHSENHWGAWSADAYYGELSSEWTDLEVNNVLGFFERNKNVPGDGKFDQSFIPSEMELQVGRVDFFNMLAFAKSEIELTRAYLQKSHRFKMGEVEVRRRALVDDNFKVQFAAPAASGWRNFAPMFGAENIDEVDYFSTLRNNTYLWSYGCGSGTHMSSEGIGSTADFANESPQSVFTMLFGSQFGDWDNDNNFLKAPLASGLTLSNVWAGNPPWHFHQMAMGYPIGYSTIRTQNSTNGGYRSGPQLVHTALMGDPSLRMHPIQPPSNLSFAQSTEANRLDWTASPDSKVIGYHIYRGEEENGDYIRINEELVEEDFFIDRNPLDGINFYQVKSVKLETTGSGSYYNQSLGLLGHIDFMVHTNSPQSINLKVFPNPSQEHLTITIRQYKSPKIELRLLNQLGQTKRLVIDHTVNSNNWSTKLNLHDLSPGLYILQIDLDKHSYFTKVIKQ